MMTTEELSDVNHYLTKAEKYELTPEVVCSALLAMKADSNLSPRQAMINGCNEWDV